jgi:hypothetical protein
MKPIPPGVKMRKLSFALFVAYSVLLLGGISAHAATYYIDCSGGSDSQNGTSQNAAWLHHPYMVGFAGHYSHVAGDQFYFKGGVTCPNSYFPLTPTAGGSSAGQDYYGPDSAKSWFAGGSWSRPIFDFGGSSLPSPNVAVALGSNTFIKFDNFEIRGFRDLGDNLWDHSIVFLFNGDHNTFTNIYMHAWVANLSGNDEMQLFGGCNGCSGGNQSNTVIEYNYMNGSDATPPSTSDGHGSGFFSKSVAGGVTAYNVVRNVSNVLIPGVGAGMVIHDNDFGFVWLSFDAADHENIMEMLVGGNTIYNNLYHDTTSAGVWPMPLAPSPNATDWVFNNVCWNVAKDCVSIDTQGVFPTYTVNLYNNTWVPGASRVCADTTNRGTSNSIGAANVVNNHCITKDGTDAESFCFNQGSTCSNVTNLVKTTNALMSVATATSQGYSWSEQFTYSATSASGSTVGAATNLTSSCSGNGSSLCSDTAYSCSVGVGNALVCPARSTTTRAATGQCTVGIPGCWDAGAYLFTGNAPPNPPTGLEALVQ